jgi:hypothetical protein
MLQAAREGAERNLQLRAGALGQRANHLVRDIEVVMQVA